jgi:molybdenum cofactor cytidylyltransferase
VSGHAAIVLAAGGSTRLGRPKQLLLRDGVPLVRFIVDVVARSAPTRLVVVVGAQRAAVEAALAGAPCELAFNEEWKGGLASSLATAARTLGAHAGPTFVATCDQPALETTHVDALLALARDAPSRCAATRHGDAPGVPAVVPSALLSRACELRGDRGFGPLLAALAPGTLGLLDAPALCMDIDDADELAAAVGAGLVDAPRGKRAT